jgi:hypothetical protein
MTNYECINCLKKFKQKSHYDKHIIKKKPCNSISVKESYISEENEEEKEENEENEENENSKCIYCEKNFTRKSSLKRHMNNRCQIKNQKEEIMKLKEMLKTIMNDCRYKNEIPTEELIETDKKDKISKTINNINNINNGTVNTGIINNTTITNIVQFGKEDIKNFNIIEMMNVFLKSTGGNIYPNMLKYININPNYPQNFNILMTDLSRENVKIHDGTKFITKKFKNVKDEILNSVNNHISNMCNLYLETPKIKKKDILETINRNIISVKLINNDDITPLIKNPTKSINNKYIKNCLSNDNIKSDENGSNDDNDDLTPEQQKEYEYYENKRQGLQEITIQKIKDELYNNKDFILQNKLK